MMSLLLLKGRPFLYKAPADMTADEDMRQLIKDKTPVLTKTVDRPSFAQAVGPVRNMKTNPESAVCEMF
jgi:hypothetical protein